MSPSITWGRLGFKQNWSSNILLRGSLWTLIRYYRQFLFYVMRINYPCCFGECRDTSSSKEEKIVSDDDLLHGGRRLTPIVTQIASSRKWGRAGSQINSPAWWFARVGDVFANSPSNCRSIPRGDQSRIIEIKLIKSWDMYFLLSSAGNVLLICCDRIMIRDLSLYVIVPCRCSHCLCRELTDIKCINCALYWDSGASAFSVQQYTKDIHIFTFWEQQV